MFLRWGNHRPSSFNGDGMSKTFKKMIIAAAAVSFLCGISGAAEQTGFWDKKEEGWFWYKQDLTKTAKKKKKEEPKTVAAQAPKQEEPKESKSEGPAVFSADWVKENLEVYKKVAWDNPTVENLRAYLTLQRFAIDRSEQFAYAGRMAVEGDPFLDEAARGPIGGAMNKGKGYLLSSEQNKVLRKLFQKVGVFFVFKNDCYLCDQQAKILKMSQNNLNVEISAVSLDEPNERSETAKIFPDYIVNPDIAKELDVKALPASFFMNTETGDIKPLVQGFVTLNDFNRRSLTTAQKYNWLPQEDFNRIKPVDDVTSLASLLNKDSDLAKRLTELKNKTNPYGEDSNYINPTVLVEEIRKEREKTLPSNFMPRGY